MTAIAIQKSPQLIYTLKGQVIKLSVVDRNSGLTLFTFDWNRELIDVEDTLIASVLATVLNRLGIALFFAIFMVIYTAVEVVFGLVRYTDVNRNMPIIIIGFFLLALLGGIISPEFTDSYIALSFEQGDIFSKIVWLLMGYVFLIGFGIGIITGVIQRAMGERTYKIF